MKPHEKAELLHLLSSEANRKKGINDYYQRRIALSGENLADHILSDEVINKLRVSIKNTTGQKLSSSEIAQALVDRLFREDKITDEHTEAIRKMERAEKQKQKIAKQ